MQDGVVTRILFQHDHFEHGRLREDALGDGTLCRGRLDGGQDVDREETRVVGEAVERLHRIEDAPLTVVLQRLRLTALVRNLELVQIIAKIEGVPKGDRGERLLDEVAEHLDIVAVRPLGVFAFFEANPQLDQFLLRRSLRYDSKIASHTSTPFARYHWRF